MKRMILKTSLGFFMIFLLSIQGFAQLSDALRLQLSSGPYSDETVVRFLEEATDSFDSDWDAYKLSNGGNTPNFYTVVNSESYTINALHKPFTNKSIPLHLRVAFSGNYTISAEEIGLFDSLCSITLIDKVLNITQNLKISPVYSFDFVMGDPADRFVIEFNMETEVTNPSIFTSVGNSSLEINLLIYNVDDKLMVDFKDISSDVTIGIYDANGRELYKEENLQISTSNSLWGFSSGFKGIHIVKVISGNQSYSKRLILN